MFIYGFGGSWFDHPFWRTRFVLASAEDLEKVQASAVPYVIIDEARGSKLEDPPAPASPAPTPSVPLGHLCAAAACPCHRLIGRRP
jgi:hypothetical protein